MSDPSTSSGLQYVVIDGAALEFYPVHVRRAAEVLMAYLDGLSAGRGLSAGALRQQIDDTANAAATAAVTQNALSVCGMIYGTTGGGSDTSGSGPGGDVVVVWGPGARDAVARLP
jgi:hypothetical protein